MRFSVIASAVVAAVVGFGGTLALIIAAAQALGATQAETASWVTACCLAMFLATGYLSWRYKMPIIAAWSTPGLALIGGSMGFTMQQAVGAFIVTAIAIILTGLVKADFGSRFENPRVYCLGHAGRRSLRLSYRRGANNTD